MRKVLNAHVIFRFQLDLFLSPLPRSAVNSSSAAEPGRRKGCPPSGAGARWRSASAREEIKLIAWNVRWQSRLQENELAGVSAVPQDCLQKNSCSRKFAYLGLDWMCEILALLESIAFFSVWTPKPAVSGLIQQWARGQTQKRDLWSVVHSLRCSGWWGVSVQQ